MGIAERYAEVGIGESVLLHRLLVACPCGVEHVSLFEYRTDICVVDGLSEVASECLLSLQCSAEHRVCRFGVAESETDVSDAVEGYHTVFHCRLVVSPTEQVAEVQRTIVVVHCLVEHSHPPEVRSDIVQRLHCGDGVTEFPCEFQFTIMTGYGFHEAVFISPQASPLLE